MFIIVSTTSTADLQVQIGDSGGVEATGYAGTVSNQGGTIAQNFSSGFDVTSSIAASSTVSGQCILSLEDSSDNTWVESSILGFDNASVAYGAGYKALTAELDRVRITTIGGGAAFDLGAINIQYSF